MLKCKKSGLALKFEKKTRVLIDCAPKFSMDIGDIQGHLTLLESDGLFSLKESESSE